MALHAAFRERSDEEQTLDVDGAWDLTEDLFNTGLSMERALFCEADWGFAKEEAKPVQPPIASLYKGWRPMPEDAARLSVQLYPVAEDALLQEKHPDLVNVLLQAFASCFGGLDEHDVYSASTLLKCIADKSNYIVTSVMQVQSRSHLGFYNMYGSSFQSQEEMPVFHGTTETVVRDVLQHDMHMRCGHRELYGPGIYFSSKFFTALAYAKPDAQGVQTVLGAMLRPGVTREGEAHQNMFGMHASGRVVNTLVAEKNTVLVVSSHTQLLPQHMIQVRLRDYNPSPMQREFVHIYHPDVFKNLSKPTADLRAALAPPAAASAPAAPPPSSAAARAPVGPPPLLKAKKTAKHLFPFKVGSRVVISSPCKKHNQLKNLTGVVRGIHLFDIWRLFIEPSVALQSPWPVNYEGQRDGWVVVKPSQVEPLRKAGSVKKKKSRVPRRQGAAATP